MYVLYNLVLGSDALWLGRPGEKYLRRCNGWQKHVMTR